MMPPRFSEGQGAKSMARRLKLLTGLSTIAMTGALALSACGGGAEGEGEGAAADNAPAGQAMDHSNHGVSEGEGEGAAPAAGGESEGAAVAADPATDDVAFLAQLALVGGHLKAFNELYHAGALENASVHMKHPESELYAALVPAFEARGTDGFAGELTALADAMAANAGVAEAYANLKSAIQSEYPTVTTKQGLLAISAVTRVAADEFDVAAEDDGTITNVKEYQDSYGFLSVAKEILDGASPSNDAERAAVDETKAQIDTLLAGFAGWTPETTSMKPSALYGAAARIEIEAKGLS